MRWCKHLNIVNLGSVP